MCPTTEAWVVVTSVGVVEALKDQGYGRWNNAVRSTHKHAKNQIRSAAQAKKLSKPSSSSSMSTSKKLRDDEGINKSEESLRTVMFLSTWGPNS
ncbi:uncharacterized protein LOC129316860 [Prosopis cineraria]|uniref:uncharacterized protein LOC129316860 n=1 Tax=Prosopis cineraria TaxID=364024 RepID=UPI00240F3579|nr:uncharacterized protein LOC129316860 [Prosopis cineraria]